MASEKQFINQESRFNNTGSWNGTVPIAFGSNTGAGNSIAVFYTVSDFAGIHTDMSAQDSDSNAYTNKTQANTSATGGAASLAICVANNIVGDVSTPMTVNGYLTTGGDVEDFQAILAIEVQATTGFIGANSQAQNALAPGSGNIQSGTVTVAANQLPALLVACAYNTSNNAASASSVGVPTVSGGLTLLTSDWVYASFTTAVFAYQVITAAGTYQAAFNQTSTVNEDIACAVAIFAGVAAPTSVPIAWING